jgi:predicted NAD/FAD-dependent oxidoreductase
MEKLELKVGTECLVIECGDVMCVTEGGVPRAVSKVTDLGEIELGDRGANYYKPHELRFYNKTPHNTFKNALLDVYEAERGTRNTKKTARDTKQMYQRWQRRRKKLEAFGLNNQAVEAQLKSEFPSLYSCWIG